MARKKIREVNAKRLLKAHFRRLCNVNLPISVAQVKENTNWTELLAENPWMLDTKLVVKPDCLFGQVCWGYGWGGRGVMAPAPVGQA
jgi:ATP citrate (pro-S)-lyase